MAKTTNLIGWLATTLVWIGAVTWGILGVTGFMGNPFNLVEWVFRMSWLINLVYTLVGLSAIYLIGWLPLSMIKRKK